MLQAPTDYKTMQGNGTADATKDATFQEAYAVSLPGCETSGVLPMSAKDYKGAGKKGK